MGSGQSLFYPDNGHRHDRAQQLADDCRYLKDQFETKKAELERILGPYQEKINRVMRAFGCNDLDDLSALVEKTGTAEALAQWNSVKGSYEKTEMVDQVIFGAMGIIATVGLTVSAVGALAGGIGFFAGIAVTGEILFALGVIGAVFDAISGAINRSQLRDSINSLFESRLKIKRITTHLSNVSIWMPIIKEVYQVFEDAGYAPDAIIARLRTRGLVQPVVDDLRDETFYKAAKDLHDMDVARGSWDNEDPGWEELAGVLQAREEAPGVRALMRGVGEAVERGVAGGLVGGLSVRRVGRKLEAVSETPAYPDIDVILIPLGSHKNISKHLCGVLKLSFESITDESAAVATIWCRNKKRSLELDAAQGKVSLSDGPQTQTKWTVSFAQREQHAQYKRMWAVPHTKVEVVLAAPAQGSGGEGEGGGGWEYLKASGGVTRERALATVFIATYAGFPGRGGKAAITAERMNASWV